MSEDLIKREDAIKAIKQWRDNDGSLFDVGLNQAIREIKRLPSADRPKEVIAQVTFDEEKLREIVKEAVERFKEEYDVVDRPQGEWKPFDLTWGRSIYACSVCEEAIAVPCGWSDGKPIYDYCPMCGAKMKGADDE